MAGALGGPLPAPALQQSIQDWLDEARQPVFFVLDGNDQPLHVEVRRAPAPGGAEGEAAEAPRQRQIIAFLDKELAEEYCKTLLKERLKAKAGALAQQDAPRIGLVTLGELYRIATEELPDDAGVTLTIVPSPELVLRANNINGQRAGLGVPVFSLPATIGGRRPLFLSVDDLVIMALETGELDAAQIQSLVEVMSFERVLENMESGEMDAQEFMQNHILIGDVRLSAETLGIEGEPHMSLADLYDKQEEAPKPKADKRR